VSVPALRRIAESQRFQTFILVVILANAVVIGLETSAELRASSGLLLHALNIIFQTIFVVEIAIRLGAYWPNLVGFFRDGWNVFDFVVVTASLLPASGPFATVARLARVLRVGRVISFVPELRLIIGTMLKSIPSMVHVIALLSVLLYVYGILGFHLFAETAPQHWGTLAQSCWTLFQILTLEGWVEVQAAIVPGQPWAWLFFGSFIVIAVFVVVNLFIAVVINNLEKVRAEDQAATDALGPHADILSRLEILREDLATVEEALRREAGRREAAETRTRQIG
jgi:voltage-gated sodium channel